MMNAMKGWMTTLNNLVHHNDSPFTLQVISCPLLPKFLINAMEIYDSTNDPIGHLESFKTFMHL